MVGEAAAEILIIALLCLFPLFGVAFNSYLHQSVPTSAAAHAYHWRTFADFATDNVARGQLAFYAISNWATALWLCGKDYKNVFAWRTAFITLGVGGFYYCGVLIDPSQVPDRAQSSVFVTSTSLYAMSMLSYFLVALYGKIPAPSAGETNDAEAESLRRKLQNRRGNQ
jgi:hypothetical protein